MALVDKMTHPTSSITSPKDPPTSFSSVMSPLSPVVTPPSHPSSTPPTKVPFPLPIHSPLPPNPDSNVTLSKFSASSTYAAIFPESVTPLPPLLPTMTIEMVSSETVEKKTSQPQVGVGAALNGGKLNSKDSIYLQEKMISRGFKGIERPKKKKTRTQMEEWETLQGKRKRATLTAKQLKEKGHPNVCDHDAWNDKDEINLTLPLAKDWN